jgi:hypothetical protein
MKTFEMKAKHGRISSEKSTFISFIAIFRKKLGALARHSLGFHFQGE